MNDKTSIIMNIQYIFIKIDDEKYWRKGASFKILEEMMIGMVQSWSLLKAQVEALSYADAMGDQTC